MPDTTGAMDFDEVEYTTPLDAITPGYYIPREKVTPQTSSPPVQNIPVLNARGAQGPEKRKPSFTCDCVRGCNSQNQPPPPKKQNNTDQVFTPNERPLLLSDAFAINKVHTKQVITGLEWNEEGEFTPAVRILATYPRKIITFYASEWEQLSENLPIMLQYFRADLTSFQERKKYEDIQCGLDIKITFASSNSGFPAVVLLNTKTHTRIYMLESTVRTLAYKKFWIDERMERLSSINGRLYKAAIVNAISHSVWADLMGKQTTPTTLPPNDSIIEHIYRKYSSLLNTARGKIVASGIDPHYFFDFFGQIITFHFMYLIEDIKHTIPSFYAVNIVHPQKKKHVTFSFGK